MKYFISTILSILLCKMSFAQIQYISKDSLIKNNDEFEFKIQNTSKINKYEFTVVVIKEDKSIFLFDIKDYKSGYKSYALNQDSILPNEIKSFKISLNQLKKMYPNHINKNSKNFYLELREWNLNQYKVHFNKKILIE